MNRKPSEALQKICSENFLSEWMPESAVNLCENVVFLTLPATKIHRIAQLDAKRIVWHVKTMDWEAMPEEPYGQ